MGVVLFAALLVTAGGWLLAGSLRLHRQTYPPICAQCGYSLRGLEGEPCPECGSCSRQVLREVIEPVRRRVRLGWGLIVLGVLSVAVWRLAVVERPRASVLPGAVKLVPRSGDYHRIVLSLVDGDGRLSSAPQYAHLQVAAQNSAEALVALDEVRAETGATAVGEAAVQIPEGPVQRRLQDILRDAAPAAPDSAIALDAADLVRVMAEGGSRGDPWAACQGSARFNCQQVTVVRGESLRFTVGLCVALLASGIAWYAGQRFMMRRVIATMDGAH